MWTTGMHAATHVRGVRPHVSGKAGDARGITCFLVPADTPGVKVEEWLWTFNMPTDHPRVSLDRCVGASRGHATGGVVDRGLGRWHRAFVHENRIRQAASSLGGAAFCVEPRA